MTESILDLLAQIDRTLDRIAIALETLVSDAGRCVHGVTGLCMSCVISNDLMRPPR